MAQKLTLTEKYKAAAKSDASGKGDFLATTISTSIFCKPSCRAGNPEPVDNAFFDSVLGALQHGFLPCMKCNPLEVKDNTPLFISKLITEIQHNPYEKIHDYELKKRGLSPVGIRSWFKKNHGMTFHAYQRLLRINSALIELNKKNSISETARHREKESESGIAEYFRSVFGVTPFSMTRRKIYITRLTTPIGPMFCCSTESGICLLDFTDRRMLENLFSDLCKRLHGVISPGSNPVLDQAKQELSEYFAGKRQRFTVPLHPSGTEFQLKAWNGLQEIPHGNTRSYSEQATLLGNPRAVRAVARANGLNKISIIIPCHRLVGSDGNLRGYGGGLLRKKWLLDLEQK